MAEVLQIYLPPAEGGAKQGVDDFLAGHSVEEFLSYATCELRESPNDHSEAPGPDTQSASLVRYAEDAELFRTPDGEAYATFPVASHLETHAVKSKAVRLWLQRGFYEEHGKPPGAQALQDALGVLEAKALFEGEEHEVNVRVACHEGAVYVDLANEAWEAIKITSEGVEVVCDPPVRFRRRKGMLALPHPVIGGNVGALRRFVNLKDAKVWRLLLAWLVQAFRPTGPYPVLILLEQFAMSLVRESSWGDGCLFGRSQTEDSRRSPAAAYEQERGSPRLRG